MSASSENRSKEAHRQDDTTDGIHEELYVGSVYKYVADRDDLPSRNGVVYEGPLENMFKWSIFISKKKDYIELPETIESVTYTHYRSASPQRLEMTSDRAPYLMEEFTQNSRRVNVTLEIKFKTERPNLKLFHTVLFYGQMWTVQNVETRQMTKRALNDDLETYDDILETARTNAWRKKRLEGYLCGRTQLEDLLLDHVCYDAVSLIIGYSVPREVQVARNEHMVLKDLANVGILVRGSSLARVTVLNCRNCTFQFSASQKCTIKNCYATEIRVTRFCKEFSLNDSAHTRINFPKRVHRINNIKVQTVNVQRSKLTAVDCRNPKSQAEKDAHSPVGEEVHIWNGRSWGGSPSSSNRRHESFSWV